MKRSTTIYILSLVLALCGNGCSASKISQGASKNQRLADCPTLPNCVSSEAQDAKHAIAPLILTGDPTTTWEAVVKAVDQLPRSTIVEATHRYLHVACKSRIFRFIDDLELLLNPDTGIIAIRSAARVGRSDLGVNRRRVEALRKKLKEDGLIE